MTNPYTIALGVVGVIVAACIFWALKMRSNDWKSYRNKDYRMGGMFLAGIVFFGMLAMASLTYAAIMYDRSKKEEQN